LLKAKLTVHKVARQRKFDPLPQQFAESFVPPERNALILETEYAGLLVQNEKILVA
jgi:hypothetical protein